MVRIDDSGLVWADSGDAVKIVHCIRASDGGPVVTPDGRPEILVWHLTGHRIPRGCDTSDRDGTAGMARRVAIGAARYYAHIYLGRDGIAWQCVPLTRRGVHVAGRWKGAITNAISTGIEVSNAGYCHRDGKAPGFVVDVPRDDYADHGGLLWQRLTEAQKAAILELALAWQMWTGADAADCVRGHHDVDEGSSHIDPGPELRDYLDRVVLARLRDGDR